MAGPRNRDDRRQRHWPGQGEADRGRASFRPAGRQDAPGSAEPLLIWGQHAVEAALRNEARTILRLVATANAASRLAGLVTTRKITVTEALPRDIDRIVGPEAVHQGVVAEVAPLADVDLETVIAAAETGGPIVVLDQVTDPHNVGAILRSAAVFGASGLVMTRRHSPPPGGVLAKAASGGLEVVPVVLVSNLARALDQLGEAHVHRLGLDGEASDLIDGVRLSRPLALVLGSEGQGLRRLTREKCDGLVRIGAEGALGSLNVSNAAAVALYETSRRTRTSSRE